MFRRFLTMKFYVFATGSLPVSPEEGAALYEASIEWMKAKFEEGKVDCHYSYPHGGGFAIVDADSHEELSVEIQGYPLFPFLNWEVIPLVDWEFGYNLAVEGYKRAAG
jgi:hypothetical protein